MLVLGSSYKPNNYNENSSFIGIMIIMDCSTIHIGLSINEFIKWTVPQPITIGIMIIKMKPITEFTDK